MSNVNLFGNQTGNMSYPVPFNQPQQVPNPYWNANPYLNNVTAANSQPVLNQPSVNRRAGSGFSGKIITNFNEILPEEVPSNGAPAIFPLADGSGILVKALDSNYNMQNQFYVKQEINTGTEGNEQPTEAQMILQRLERIESILSSYDSGNHSNAKSGGKQTQKKEEVKNESE